MEPIRILHIVASMAMGGTENFLMTNYRNIDRSRVQFDFLKHRDFKDFYDDEILSLGGRIYSVPSINPFYHSRYYNEIAEFFKMNKERYTIVHSHMNSISAFPLRAAKNEGIPVRIAHMHAVPKGLNYKTPVFWYTKNVISKYYTDAFACSKEAGNWLYGDTSFTVIPNAIDSSLYISQEQIRREVREEFNVSDGFVIGMVANFRPVKNHEFIVNVFSKLLNQIPNARMILVGSGPETSNIKKIVTEMNLNDKIIFAGVRNDVNRILQGFDIFVLPSISEGFAISVLEAEAVGIPCVVSTGVPKEVKLFNDMNTSFVSIDNENAWIEKIVSLQKATRKSWVKEICETQYDVGNNAKRLMEFYESKYRMVKNR